MECTPAKFNNLFSKAKNKTFAPCNTTVACFCSVKYVNYNLPVNFCLI